MAITDENFQSVARRNSVTGSSPVIKEINKSSLDLAMTKILIGSRHFGTLKTNIQVGINNPALAGNSQVEQTGENVNIFGAGQGVKLIGRPKANSIGTTSALKDKISIADRKVEDSPIVKVVKETAASATSAEDGAVKETFEFQLASLGTNLRAIATNVSDVGATVYTSDEESVNGTGTSSEAEAEDEELSYGNSGRGFDIRNSLPYKAYIVDVRHSILAPLIDAYDKRDLDQARKRVIASRGVYEKLEDIADNTMIQEYSEDIFNWFRQLEHTYMPGPNYMQEQQEIMWDHRTILIDWIVQVHERFQMLPETLFLAVNIIDRFMSVKTVSLSKLQLVGATALFIAGKVEEVNPPNLDEICFMVEETFSKEEITKAESFMLDKLGWRVSYPGPMSFLRLVSKADEYDNQVRTLAKYFLEVAMMDRRFVACPPSLAAAGSHCLARFIYNRGGWSFAHIHYAGYTYGHIFPFMYTLLSAILSDPARHHPYVRTKYMTSKFNHGFDLVQNALHSGFRLPGYESRGAIDFRGPDFGQRFYPEADLDERDFLPGKTQGLSKAARRNAIRVLRSGYVV